MKLLAQKDQSSTIGTAKVSKILSLNAKLLREISEVTDSKDMTNILDIINGELGRAIDAREGNASELETAVIINNLEKIADGTESSLNDRVKRVLNVSIETLKEACPAKQRG